jgi:hypothetical protein
LFSISPGILFDLVYLLKILLFFLKVIKFIFGNNFLNFALLLLYVFLYKFVTFKNLLFVIVNLRFILGSELAEFWPVFLLVVIMSLE